MILEGLVADWVPKAIAQGADWERLTVYRPETADEETTPVLVIIPQSPNELAEIRDLMTTQRMRQQGPRGPSAQTPKS